MEERDEVLFGPFRFDIARQTLWHGQTNVGLKPKEALLLALLAANRPNPVAKNDIVEALWPGSEPTDAALTQTLYRLRQALNRYAPVDCIRTVHGVGLQFAGVPDNIGSEDAGGGNLDFSLFQRATYFFERRTESGTLEAIRLAEAACTSDPAFAPGLTLLAKAYTNAGTRLFYDPQKAYWRAKRALQRAVEIDPMSADAHATLATLLLFFNADWESAEACIERAQVLAPNHPTVRHASVWERLARGFYGEAITQATYSLRARPSSPFVTSLLAIALYMSGRFDEALRHFSIAREFDASNAPALFFESCAACLLEEYASASGLIDLIHGGDIRPRVVALRGYIAAKLRRPPEARAALAKLEAEPDPTGVSEAIVQIGLGNMQAASSAVNRAFETREPGLFLVAVDPIFAPLRAYDASLFTRIARGRRPLCDRCGAALPRPPSTDPTSLLLCFGCRQIARDAVVSTGFVETGEVGAQA